MIFEGTIHDIKFDLFQIHSTFIYSLNCPTIIIGLKLLRISKLANKHCPKLTDKGGLCRVIENVKIMEKHPNLFAST